MLKKRRMLTAFLALLLAVSLGILFVQAEKAYASQQVNVTSWTIASNSARIKTDYTLADVNAALEGKPEIAAKILINGMAIDIYNSVGRGTNLPITVNYEYGTLAFYYYSSNPFTAQPFPINTTIELKQGMPFAASGHAGDAVLADGVFLKEDFKMTYDGTVWSTKEINITNSYNAGYVAIITTNHSSPDSYNAGLENSPITSSKIYINGMTIAEYNGLGGTNLPITVNLFGGVLCFYYNYNDTTPYPINTVIELKKGLPLPVSGQYGDFSYMGNLKEDFSMTWNGTIWVTREANVIDWGYHSAEISKIIFDYNSPELNAGIDANAAIASKIYINGMPITEYNNGGRGSNYAITVNYMSGGLYFHAYSSNPFTLQPINVGTIIELKKGMPFPYTGSYGAVTLASGLALSEDFSMTWNGTAWVGPYSIKFHANGGTGVRSTVVKPSSASYTLPLPTLEGDEFLGWYETSDFTGTPVTVIEQGNNQNWEFYAKWRYSSEFVPSMIFTDNMILQRNALVPVYGTGIDGVEVTVTFGSQVKSTVVADGKWSVSLDPMAASLTPQALTVASPYYTYSYQNVLVGEVWVASGQSNMEWTVDWLKTANTAQAALYNNYNNYDSIRMFRKSVVNSIDYVGPNDADTWIASNNTLKSNGYLGMSAYALGFALELQVSLGNVPVGIVLSAVGGSTIEEWMSAQSISTAGSTLVNGMDSRFYNGMTSKIFPNSVAGVIWYQGESDYSNPNIYEGQFAALCNQYRQLSGNAELPVIYAQLPQYGLDDWKDFRLMQWSLMDKIENVYAVCGIDLGETDNIHPADKLVFAQRAAEIAKAYVYEISGAKGLSAYPTSIDSISGTIRVNYTGASFQGFAGSVYGFEVAGADKVFAPCPAEISGSSLILSGFSKKIQYVRYLYGATFPSVDLYTTNGLPAAPFYLEVTSELFTFTLQTEGLGAINSDKAEVTSGGSITFTFAPEQNYYLGRVLVNGDKVIFADNQYSVNNITSDFTIKAVYLVEVSSIEVTAPANKTYIKGDELNLTGGFITVNYVIGEAGTLALTNSDVLIEGYNKAVAGTQTVSVTFGGKTDTFNVNVLNSNNLDPYNNSGLLLGVTYNAGNSLTLNISGGPLEEAADAYEYQYWIKKKVDTDSFNDNGIFNPVKAQYIWQLVRGYEKGKSFTQSDVNPTSLFVDLQGRISVIAMVRDSSGKVIDELYGAYTFAQIGMPVINGISVGEKIISDDYAIVYRNFNMDITVKGIASEGAIYSLLYKDEPLAVANSNGIFTNIDTSAFAAGKHIIKAVITLGNVTCEKEIKLYVIDEFDAAVIPVITSLEGSSAANGATTFTLKAKFADGTAISEAQKESFIYALKVAGNKYIPVSKIVNAAEGTLDVTYSVNLGNGKYGVYQVTGEISREDVNAADDKIIIYYKGYTAKQILGSNVTLSQTSNADTFGSGYTAPVNTPITITASGSIAGAAGVEYAFYREDASGWILVRDYGSPEFIWQPVRAGIYNIQVRIKDTSAGSYEDWLTKSYKITSGEAEISGGLNIKFFDYETGNEVAELISGKPYKIYASYTGYIDNQIEEILYMFTLSSKNLGTIYLNKYTASPYYMFIPSKADSYTITARAILKTNFGYKDISFSRNISSVLE